jgi:hypothetical protein
MKTVASNDHREEPFVEVPHAFATAFASAFASAFARAFACAFARAWREGTPPR